MTKTRFEQVRESIRSIKGFFTVDMIALKTGLTRAIAGQLISKLVWWSEVEPVRFEGCKRIYKKGIKMRGQMRTQTSMKKRILKWIEENPGEFTNQDVREALGLRQPAPGKNDSCGIEISWLCADKRLERCGFKNGRRVYRPVKNFTPVEKKVSHLPPGVRGIIVHKIDDGIVSAV